VKAAVTKQHQEEIGTIAADVRRGAKTIPKNRLEVIDEMASFT
jgi:hypothetical protein